MSKDEKVREHLNTFFVAVAKRIVDELLIIFLLYSLPASYETFRWAVETGDELPKADVFHGKIFEEYKSRKSKENKVENNNVLYIKKNQNQPLIEIGRIQKMLSVRKSETFREKLQ